MTNINKLRRAVGPFYRGKPLHTFTDDELVAAIDTSRRESIDKFVAECWDHVNFCWSRKEIGEIFEREFHLDPMNIEIAAVKLLQDKSPEGWGDATSRLYDDEYNLLWAEALDRSDRLVDQARVDGGWGE